MVWYYVKDGVRQGPVEEAEFSRLVGQSIVRSDTLVWHEGMSDWSAYSSVPPAATPAAPVPTPVTAEVRVEPTPVQEPEKVFVAAAPVASAVASRPLVYCSQCGQPYRSEDMVRFGAVAVCANCKEIYAQRLRETGQVTAARVYGGFWIRFLALLIDVVILGAVFAAVAFVFGIFLATTRNVGVALGSLGLMYMGAIGLSMVYECYFLVNNGATPGKMVLGLKVITPDGGGITWGRAIGRFFAKGLSGMILYIGYIIAGFDLEKRALHDHLAGTRVIRST